jgi:hypothetical protein
LANIASPSKSGSFAIDIPATMAVVRSFETRASAKIVWAQRKMEMSMSNKIHELLNRNLQEVFGDGDAARRRAAIEELYTEDCVLYVPVGVFVGRDALDKFAGNLRATHPHFAYTPHGEPQRVSDVQWFRHWFGGNGRRCLSNASSTIVLSFGRASNALESTSSSWPSKSSGKGLPLTIK